MSKGTGITGYMDHCSCCDVSEITGSVSYTQIPGVSVTRRTIAFLQTKKKKQNQTKIPENICLHPLADS